MIHYLRELEVIPFISKKSQEIKKINNNIASSEVTELDLLLVLEKPQSLELSEMFNKLLNSLKIIKSNIRYECIYLDFDSINKLLTEDLNDQLGFFRLRKLIIFGEQTPKLQKVLTRYYGLNPEDLLQAKSLESLSKDVNSKKLLWQSLQQFLV